MIFQDFIHTIKDGVSERLDADYSVSLQQVLKNNGVCYESLLIMHRGTNLSPMIYLNPYYHRYLNGMPIPDICDDICSIYHRKYPAFVIDADFFSDYEKVRVRLVPKLIHYEKNKELLADAPHIRKLDLAMVFLYLLDTATDDATGDFSSNDTTASALPFRYPYASILIRNQHMELWHVTTESLYRDAFRNAPVLLPPEIKSMPELLREFEVNFYDNDYYHDFDIFNDSDDCDNCCEDNDDSDGFDDCDSCHMNSNDTDDFDDCDNCCEDSDDSDDFDDRNNCHMDSDDGFYDTSDNDEVLIPPMYVVTNTLRINGAVCALYDDVLARISRCLESDLIVLPSSIHEMILVPTLGLPREELGEFEQMVQEVNATQVADDEVLSNHAYYYDADADRLSIL